MYPETYGHQQEETRVLIVDDHVAVRQALASVIDQEPTFAVVGQAGSLAEARQMLNGVDVAVIDLALPDGYGGKLIRELRCASPNAVALVLSANLDRMEMARALEHGAAGVMHKSSDIEELTDAMRRLQEGKSLLPPEEMVELFRLASSQREQEREISEAIARLTFREKEVLQALAEGLNRQEIAERFHISVGTVRNHISSILSKLGVHSQAQALVFGLRHSVISVR